MKARKSWQEKLNDAKGLPKIGKIEANMSKRWGTGTMVIPAPVEVKELMDKVPKGKLATINELRIALAKKHKTSIACPITTGIFAWIAANAADEAAAAGAKRITPYWRTLKAGGELNPRYPGGVEGLREKLESEGHRVIQRGKKFVVENYANRVCSL
jgi:hypothetical protein